ncbi:hypothetical protein F5Y17DRAFT_425222, partial [Xylariaceae sp. FL0594]
MSSSSSPSSSAEPPLRSPEREDNNNNNKRTHTSSKGSSGRTNHHPLNTLSPADRVRERRRIQNEEHGGVPRYAHPEVLDPDTYKSSRGHRMNRPKRVDGPPDGRHHQALSDRV